MKPGWGCSDGEEPTWQNDKAVLARVGGELVLNKDASFWQVREYQRLLRGRPYRITSMRL